MTKRKWIISTSSFLLVLLLLAGYMAIAAEYGSEQDPLVSASYITEILAPDTIKRVNETIDQKVQQFTIQLNQQFAAYSEELDAMMREFEQSNRNNATDSAFIDAVATQVIARMSGGGGGSEEAGTGGFGWRMIDIEKGSTYVFDVGGMILPRIGSAVCFALGSPGLINVTTGGELASGGAPSTNNLYVGTVKGRGFTATAATGKFIVSGDYTVSTD